MILKFVLVGGALLCLAGAAWAQSSSGDAEKLIRKGVELRKEGDERGALSVLQQAYQTEATPRAAGQLALAEQALGRWVGAEAHLKEALHSESDPWVQRNRATLKEALGTIENHLGTLEVTGAPVGASVYIDGQATGKLPLSDPLRVAAGPITVEMRASGYITAGKTVSIRAGGYERIFVGLFPEPTLTPTPPPAPAPSAGPRATPAPAAVVAESGQVTGPTDSGDSAPPASSSGRSSLKWIAWGAGAIGLGVGIYGAVENSRGTTSFDAAGCRIYNGVAVSTSAMTSAAACNDMKNSYESKADIGIAGFIAAGALAATGAVLWLTEPRLANHGVATASCQLFLATKFGAECTLRF